MRLFKVLMLVVVGLAFGCGDERGGDGGGDNGNNEAWSDPLIRFDVDLNKLPEECFYSPSVRDDEDRFTNRLDGLPTISEVQIEPGETSFGPFRVDMRAEWKKHDFGGMAAERGPGIVGAVEFAGISVALVDVKQGFEPIDLTLREESGAIVWTARLESHNLYEGTIDPETGMGWMLFRAHDVEHDSKKRYFIDVDTPISFHLQVVLEIEGVFVKSECL